MRDGQISAVGSAAPKPAALFADRFACRLNSRRRLVGHYTFPYARPHLPRLLGDGERKALPEPPAGPMDGETEGYWGHWGSLPVHANNAGCDRLVPFVRRSQLAPAPPSGPPLASLGGDARDGPTRREQGDNLIKAGDSQHSCSSPKVHVVHLSLQSVHST
jgi:hypothetical protein